MEELNLIQKIAIYSLPVIFAITLHEASHAYIARYFGDDTAEKLGRISLNPIKHIDIVGTIILPALFLSIGGILFGWAKPVPINFQKLHHPKRDTFWVALAGPGSNLIMAIFWAVVMKWASFAPGNYGLPMALMGKAGIEINVVLMALNLLPLLPLDGGRMLGSILPSRASIQFSRLEPFGLFILLALLLSGLLNTVLMPMISGSIQAILWMVG